MFVCGEGRNDFTVDLETSEITITDDEHFPENGASIIIVRSVPLRQALERPEAGQFSSSAIEQKLDRIVR